ncbi:MULTISPECIES: PLD nuclease N-terminal domain-containing protein [unclassified Clostridioides]|uniref:PLD nuclease N-terminal domain-containing protein n=1 Tax=unclassified Clostridioides TaxID=2635829 RepID=UPI0006BBDD8A|nr:membrane protein [Clostridioides difficile]MCC0693594.1 PLDc_N domain-containing protein [Clostridioides sp. ZZV14-6387]MCI9976997.1 PLDc_N domain-containing protein [Clostridioides difficile]MDI0267010.1 PLD nuclease N-terminal domain-containing protein [Clostridioides difficile]MDI7818340.1 PLD nuclease N-terminal domain-containing protein [Clostridioides difficile]
MENLMENLPLLLPIIILNLILVITALIHIIKHPNYKIGNKAIWILLVLFISIIGPILYFTIGRGDE